MSYMLILKMFLLRVKNVILSSIDDNSC